MSEAWKDEGFEVENDLGDESIESDPEEDDVLELDELEEEAAWEESADESDDAQ